MKLAFAKTKSGVQLAVNLLGEVSSNILRRVSEHGNRSEESLAHLSGKKKAHKLKKVLGTPAGCPWDTLAGQARNPTGPCPRNFLSFTLETLKEEGICSRFAQGHPPHPCYHAERSGPIFILYREEKGTQTQTFGSGYLLVGWGASTLRGGSQKVRYVLPNPGKPNFLAGYPGILPGYPAKSPKSLRRRSLCSILVP